MQLDNPKVISIEEMRAERDKLVAQGKKLVFTNGCFDMLHRGHVTYLTFARNQGDALVVGLNADASVRANKGDDRPINSQQDRAFVLGHYGLWILSSGLETRSPRTSSREFCRRCW